MAGKHNHIQSGKNLTGELTLIEIAKRFSTEEAAREYFEKLRWPNGPICAHCGNADQDRIYKVTPNPAKKFAPVSTSAQSADKVSPSLSGPCVRTRISR